MTEQETWKLYVDQRGTHYRLRGMFPFAHGGR
jgi:hypothetical protein